MELCNPIYAAKDQSFNWCDMQLPYDIWWSQWQIEKTFLGCFNFLQWVKRTYLNSKTNIVGQSLFLGRFPISNRPKLKVPWYQGRWPQIKKCKKTNLLLNSILHRNISDQFWFSAMLSFRTKFTEPRASQSVVRLLGEKTKHGCIGEICEEYVQILNLIQHCSYRISPQTPTSFLC